MKYVASVSFGKDSLAMLLMLIEKHYPLDYVVFYDTGMEFDAIYNVRDKVVKDLTKAGIKFIVLRPKEPFWISMLIREVKNRKKDGLHYGYSWCGTCARWGTQEKITAIRKFEKSLCDDVTEYVGIAADELQRIGKAVHEGKTFPLVDWAMTEADCLKYCRDKGFSWDEDGADLYDVLQRVSCWCCRNKNLTELKAIYKHLPKYWKRLKGLEYRLNASMKNKPLVDLEKKWAEENE